MIENEAEEKTELLLNYHFGKFGINKGDISFLIDPDKVDAGISQKMISEKGGIQGLFLDLNVNPLEGLLENNEEIELRKKVFGENLSVLPKTKHLFYYMISTLKDKMIIFLLIAATLRLFLDIYKNSHKWFDVIAIYMVIVIISVVDGITKYLKDIIFVSLHKELSDKNLRVFREGKETMIKKSELVVGDILIINSGDIISNDGIIIKAYSVEILDHNKEIKVYNNISFLKRWDSPYFKKASKDFPIILSNSKVSKGFAYVLILSVGENISSQIYRNSNNTEETVEDEKEVKDDNSLNDSLPVIDFLKPSHNANSNLSQKATNTSSNPNALFIQPEIVRKESIDKEKKSPNKKTNHHQSKNKKKQVTGGSTSTSRRNSMDENINLYSTIEAEAIGHINSFLNEDHYLSIKIHKVSNFITKVGLVISVVVWILLVIRFIVSARQDLSLLFVVVDDLLYSIVLVIIAIPEGIKLTFLLTVAFSIKSMTQENTLIKNIDSLEDMACCDVICMDFKGVLTENESKVKSIFIENNIIEYDDIMHLRHYISEDMYAFLCEAICINSTAFFAEVREINNNYIKHYIGQANDCALLKFMMSLGENYTSYRNNYNRPIIDCSPNTPDALFSYTVIEMSEKSDKIRVYVTGEYEALIDYVTVYIEDSSEKASNNKQSVKCPILTQIQSNHIAKLNSIVTNNANSGLNSVVLCYRDIPREQYYRLKETYANCKEDEFSTQLIKQLSLIAIIGLNNELKSETIQFIKECYRAGIQVKMITNQDKYTATLGGVNCGLIPSNVLNTKKDSRIDQGNYSIEDHKTSEEALNVDLSNSNESDNLKLDGKRESILRKAHQVLLDAKTEFKVLIDEQTKNNNIVDSINNKYNKNDNNNLNSDNNNDKIAKYYQKSYFSKFSVCSNNEKLHRRISITPNNSALLQKSLAEMKVLYKASSVEKMYLVRFLTEIGYVVAYAGDCSSDAEAMRVSHVGISVGKHTSDSTKEVSDLILNKESVHSILTTVTFGRHMFNNVRKFTVFYISFSFSIMSIIMISSLPGFYFCFYPNKLLWVYLLVNTLGALSLASTKANREELLFNRRPYNKTANLVTKEMKVKIIVQVIVQLVIMVIIFLLQEQFGDLLYYLNTGIKYIESEKSNEIVINEEGVHNGVLKISQRLYRIHILKTCIFHILVLMQIFNALISRSYFYPEKLFTRLLDDTYFCFIQGIVLILELLCVHFGRYIMKTDSLTLSNNLLCILISSLVLVSVPLMKKFSIKEKEQLEEEKKIIRDLIIKDSVRSISVNPPTRRKTQLILVEK